jgi:hypothetical protein
MKKFALLLLALVGFAITAQAQLTRTEYKLFKVDMASGYSRPTSTVGDISGGLNLSIEPKFNIFDQIAVGVKFEAAALASGSQTSGVVVLMRNTSLTGEYYFGQKTVRPYIRYRSGNLPGGSIQHQ